MVDCLFVDDVVCIKPEVISCAPSSLPQVCIDCVYFSELMDDMADEEERFFDECDEIRRTGVYKLSGSREGK